jgi:hypothetical protein
MLQPLDVGRYPLLDLLGSILYNEIEHIVVRQANVFPGSMS